ncbi:terpene synthase family protein [Micromonospora sp. WMMD1082]|uniref:terpene synthase family protein n=1 Tax=Micromonospora sp. WMMD1082 TaxID=3016104 RepID=UPI002415BA10|nr:terpene synthase family protein [Micromonospora sp. WMMD1082]MDG4794526.1 terpene synthase family protein [Micromonospora sp. WMMD1082]
MPPDTPAIAFEQAAEHGRICSVAARGQRDLQERVAAYRDLFPDPPVDATMLSALALSTAFIAPWCSASDLRTANRTSLWVTAEDWRIDSVAASLAEATATATACLSVAAGATPADGDELARFLADIRDDLAVTPLFARLGHLWQDELRRMLDAELQEWQWKAARNADPADLPSPGDYLANAAGYGATWVNISHWIATSAVDTEDQLVALVTASQEVEKVLRLVNDLASYDRDVKAGDLNILMLGIDEDEVRQQVAALIERCDTLLDRLTDTCAQQVGYLRRVLGFTTGFYHGTDFWGPR